MTERERYKRRQKMRAMRRKREQEKEKPSREKNLFFFRCYVTAVVIGCLFLAGKFETETTLSVENELKRTIAEQITTDELSDLQKTISSFLQDRSLSIPVFQEEESEPEYLPDLEDSSP